MGNFKFLRFFESIYLLLVGVGIGAIITCVFSASVVFHAGDILNMPSLTNAESGKLMGDIFVKTNYVFLIIAVAIIVFELLGMRIFRTSTLLTSLSGGISVIAILLFVLYYTPAILGATDFSTPEFQSIHFQSELCFKILFVSLIVLFISKCLKIAR
ncbi:DUF4149 domain-containing protein [Helicobacter sp. MIT 00-7814]|uniref:DUF4149 domain-containing protein n=1 Tax=unclassified Helicobacter TaxID=2593540 RepID=UPI000E1F4997|nr:MULTISPECIES: DUF4149 domain-containing protein [unclassified Helicobacter]RDU54354.1 DUF4149 domain-containing protein [Helicobacter sp. MIT 99-10781]RDU54431.1 DUF4149 domain-containing protein [Helicobacter sp. MIT 00-7814]